MTISKRENKRTYIHDENPDRRVRTPNWRCCIKVVEDLKAGAKKNRMSVSCFLEQIVRNFLILEYKTPILTKKNSVLKKRDRMPCLTMHPKIIEVLNDLALASEVSCSEYIEALLQHYFYKYEFEIKLRKLTHFL